MHKTEVKMILSFLIDEYMSSNQFTKIKIRMKYLFAKNNSLKATYVLIFTYLKEA